MLNIPVFLASDNNYAPFVATTMASICDNTKSFIEFYILDSGISSKNKIKLQELNKEYKNFSIEFISIDESHFSIENYTNSAEHVSLATYNRFLIPELKPNIDKAIYLDVDIIACDDIKELYENNLASYPLGAVGRSISEAFVQNQNKLLSLDKDNIYFNAGVLLINCKKWRENNISKELFKLEKKIRDIIRLADQDVLNSYFAGNYLLLDRKYNFQMHFYDEGIDCAMALRHYSSDLKPWHFASNIKTDVYKDLELFWKYANKTSFLEEINAFAKYKKVEDLRMFHLKNMLNKRQ